MDDELRRVDAEIEWFYELIRRLEKGELDAAKLSILAAITNLREYRSNYLREIGEFDISRIQFAKAYRVRRGFEDGRLTSDTEDKSAELVLKERLERFLTASSKMFDRNKTDAKDRR